MIPAQAQQSMRRSGHARGSAFDRTAAAAGRGSSHSSPPGRERSVRMNVALFALPQRFFSKPALPVRPGVLQAVLQAN